MERRCRDGMSKVALPFGATSALQLALFPFAHADKRGTDACEEEARLLFTFKQQQERTSYIYIQRD